MTTPILDIATLRNFTGSLGQLANITSTNQVFYWDNTTALTDNGVTMVNVAGVSVGGWRLQMGDAGFIALTNTTLAAITGGTAETTIFSKVIKGNLLGTTRAISYLLNFNITTGVSLLPSITLRIKYGSSTLTLVSGAVLAANLTSKAALIRGRVYNIGITNNQLAYGELEQDNSTIGLTGKVLANTLFTVDSTIDQTFSITAQLGPAVGTTTLTFLGANIVTL